MNILIASAEWLTYLFFSILAGHIVLLFVPEGKKPAITLSKNFLLTATLGIVFSSFGPVLQVVLYFYESVGVAKALHSVLTDFQVGQSWLLISWICLFMIITILCNGTKYIKALWLLIMVLAVGYSSHVASLSLAEGWIGHSLHFLAVIIWAGVLLHVAWFAKEPWNWEAFVKWFSPLAAVCMLIILGTGFFIMSMVVEVTDYVNSWVLPYGQTLLLKHIVIIPLLLIAFSNAYLSKKQPFKLKEMVKAESVVFFLVIACTAFLGVQSPPHDIDFTVDSEGASAWAEFLAENEIQTPIALSLGTGSLMEGLSLVLIATGFAAILFFSIKKYQSRNMAIVFTLLLIISLYFGLNSLFL